LKQRQGTTLEKVIELMDRQIITAIKNFHLFEDSPEDVRNDFYLDMLNRDCFKNFNPSKSQLNTYIYTCLRNYCLKRKRSYLYKKRAGRLKTFSYHNNTKYSENFNLLETLKSTEDTAKEVEDYLFIEDVRKESGQKRYILIETANNTEIPLKKVIDMLVLGYNGKEIIDTLGISSTALVNRMKRLSERPFIREYFETYL